MDPGNGDSTSQRARALIASKTWRVILRWATVMALLVAMGWTLHAWLPPVPRWVVHGQIAALGLSGDGTTYQTETRAADGMPSSARSPMFPSALPKSGPVQVWDVETGRLLQSVLGEHAPRWRTTLSNDGKRLMAVEAAPEGALHEELRCIDLVTGQERRTTTPHRSDYWQPSFSPDGSLLELIDWGDDTRAIAIYDRESLRLLANFKEEKPWLGHMWSRDGKAVLIYSADPQTGATLRRISPEADTTLKLNGAGPWLALSPDGKLLATEPARGDADDLAPVDAILLWNTDTGQQCGRIAVADLHGRAAGCDVYFGAQQTLMVTHGMPRPGNTISIWDLQAGKWLGEVPINPYEFRCFPEQNGLAVYRRNQRHTVEWYRLRPFGKLWQRTWPEGTRTWVSLEHVNPDLDRLLVLSGDQEASHNRLQLLDPQTGNIEFDLPLDPKDSQYWRLTRTQLALQETPREPPKRGAFWEFVEERILGAIVPTVRRGGKPVSTTRILDVETGAEIGRIDLAGADLYGFAADGRSVFLYQEAGPGGDAALSCYDVPPRRPWAWILGVPLVVGMIVLATRIAWRIIKRPANDPGGASVGA